MLQRLRREDDGFALVTAIAVLAVMTMLLVVVLAAGQSSFTLSERNSRFTRTLGIAEAGVNDAITRLGESRTSTNPCPLGTSTVCQSAHGEYQLTWTDHTVCPLPETAGSGSITICSVGYYPSMANEQVTREVRVVLAPESLFKYALYSNSTLDIKNSQTVIGDVYASQKITFGNNATVCGSIVNASGGVAAGNGAQIVKQIVGDANHPCSGQSGNVWAGGTIDLGGVVQGDATASAPSGTACPPTPNTTYAILGGTVQGHATACGAITSTTSGGSPNTASSPPAAESMPTYTFDPSNYPGIHCYPNPAPNPCNPTVTSATAVSSFNSGVSKANMTGTYAIWQTQPTKNTRVDLSSLTLAGDLTIVSNAPIDLGNTGEVTSSVPANLTIVSLYVPPTGTTCDANGGDCSIYGKNKVVFDNGTAGDPDDGVVGLLYTPGKMAFKNNSNEGDGALYAGSMDLKNGFDVTYNSRIERTLGFGTGLEQILWQEVSD